VGQSWWWVVLAVVVIALLVAVALLRSRHRRVDAPAAATNVEIAAAAAGGTAGAVGAAAVAAAHAEKDAAAGDEEDADPGEPEEGAVTTDADADRPAPSDAATAGQPDTAIDEPADPGAEISAAAESAGAAEPEVFENGSGGSSLEGEDAAPVPDRAAPNIPAPREEPSVARRRPEPADSALAALDSGLAGPGLSFAAAAAAAVSARPGPYPGSLLPAADGTSPSPLHRIKANEGSRRYHTPDSPYYVRTRGDAWFRTEDEAGAAGFTAWNA